MLRHSRVLADALVSFSLINEYDDDDDDDDDDDELLTSLHCGSKTAPLLYAKIVK